jgi:hypothetical protein
MARLLGRRPGFPYRVPRTVSPSGRTSDPPQQPKSQWWRLPRLTSPRLQVHGHKEPPLPCTASLRLPALTGLQGSSSGNGYGSKSGCQTRLEPTISSTSTPNSNCTSMGTSNTSTSINASTGGNSLKKSFVEKFAFYPVCFLLFWTRNSWGQALSLVQGTKL